MSGSITMINIMVVVLAVTAATYAVYKLYRAKADMTAMIVVLALGTGIAGLAIASHLQLGSEQIRTKRRITKLQIDISTLQKKAEHLQITNQRLEELAGLSKKEAKDYPKLDIRQPAPNMKSQLQHPRIGASSSKSEIKKSVFMMEEYSKKKLDYGTFEIRFTLVPKGQGIIPVFQISCKTQNYAQIMKFDIKGSRLPGEWDKKSSAYNTVEFRGTRKLRPQKLEVVIVTDRDPGVPFFSIYPMKLAEGDLGAEAENK